MTRHLFVSVLGWRWSPYHGASRERLVLSAQKHGYKMTPNSCQVAGVDRSRNICIAQFLDTDATHHMFIDADLFFNPEDIWAMMESGYDVVGGIYPKKEIAWSKVAAAVRAGVPDDKLRYVAEDHVLNAYPSEITRDKLVTDKKTGHRYLSVKDIGTGFLMTTRSCIERYIKAYDKEIEYISNYEPSGKVHHVVFGCEIEPNSPRRQAERSLLKAARDGEDLSVHASKYRDECSNVDKLHQYLTEDYSFCRRWQMLGEKTWCAVDANLAHQGSYVFESQLSVHFPKQYMIPTISSSTDGDK